MRSRPSVSERDRSTVRVPIFTTSAVSGEGLQLLHSFLRALQPATSGGQGAGGNVPLPPGQLVEGGEAMVAAAATEERGKEDPVLFQVWMGEYGREGVDGCVVI